MSCRILIPYPTPGPDMLLVKLPVNIHMRESADSHWDRCVTLALSGLVTLWCTVTWTSFRKHEKEFAASLLRRLLWLPVAFKIIFIFKIRLLLTFSYLSLIIIILPHLFPSITASSGHLCHLQLPQCVMLFSSLGFCTACLPILAQSTHFCHSTHTYPNQSICQLGPWWKPYRALQREVWCYFLHLLISKSYNFWHGECVREKQRKPKMTLY